MTVEPPLSTLRIDGPLKTTLSALFSRSRGSLVIIAVSVALFGCSTVHKVEPFDESQDPVDRGPETIAIPPVGLCLSGGGYRAMLFHTGVALRLYETGRLSKFNIVSGVSGGAITAAWLGVVWSELMSEPEPSTSHYERLVIVPLRKLASTTIDVPSAVKGLLLPGSASKFIAVSLDDHLFKQRTLRDLPSPIPIDRGLSAPIVRLSATNLLTGRPWFFTRESIGDVGRESGGVIFRHPDLRLSVAVSASAAFPPFLAPVRLDVSGLEKSYPEVERVPALDGTILGDRIERGLRRRIQYEKDFFDDVLRDIPLADGGISSNLALHDCAGAHEKAFVSSALASTDREKHVADNWVSVSRAVMESVYARAEAKDVERLRFRNTEEYIYLASARGDNVRESLRSTPLYVFLSNNFNTMKLWAKFRALEYKTIARRAGWEILEKKLKKSRETIMLGVSAIQSLAKNQGKAVRLASVPTRLARLDACEQEHLINWGYVLTDMAMDVRANWRVFTKGFYEKLIQGKLADIEGEFDLWSQTRFELPYALDPFLQLPKYWLLKNSAPPPLKSECKRANSVVLGSPKSPQ